MTLESKLRALVAGLKPLMEKAAPLPWYVSRSGSVIAVRSTHATLVANCTLESNATLIVAAVNAVSQLEALLAERQEPPESDYIHIEAAARRGLFAWRDKPHNAKWWRKIDGTPIPNDLIVCVAQEITRMLAAAAPSGGTGESK